MQIENLLFILLVAMAVLFRVLASKLGEAKKSQQDSDRRAKSRPPPIGPLERAPAESDEERIRKFLEALGQPTGSRPPPPVAPRTDIPPRPVAPVQPPPAPLWELTRAERRKRKEILEEATPTGGPTPAEKIFPPKITRASAFEIHEGPLPPEPPGAKAPAETFAAVMQPTVRKAEKRTDIATLLASKSGLRSAIILREIFGPPRSLQPLDRIGSA